VRKTIALFDFDNTLFKGESGIQFIHYYLGGWRSTIFFARYCLTVIKYLCKMNDELALQHLVSALLKGEKVTKVKAIADNFYREIIEPKLNKNIFSQLCYHQSCGHRCIIVSRSLDVYLEPWAQAVDVEVLSTKLETSGTDTYTGRIIGSSCYGNEKSLQINSLLKDCSQYEIYAYGDSRGDKEMLELANYAYYCKEDDFKLLSNADLCQL